MKKITLSILILSTLIPSLAQSQVTGNNPAPTPDTYKLLAPLPCIEGTGSCTAGTIAPEISLNDYIGYVFKFSIALAVFLAVIMIIWGGFQYITSEVPFIKSNGKQTIQNAAIGLIGVLASYLVLRTIDPRLVAVNTRLEPIVMPTPDVTSFSNNLEGDLRKLSQETQVKINETVSQIKAQQQELERINYALENDQELSEEAREQLIIDKAKIEQGIQTTKNNQSKLVAEAIGANNFNNILSILNDPGSYTQSGTYKISGDSYTYLIDNSGLASSLEGNVESSKAVIAERYDEYMKKIGSSDPEALQKLQKQKDFYLSEIETQQNLLQTLMTYKSTSKSIDGNDSRYNRAITPQVQALLEKYKKEEANPTKAVGTGLENEYKTLTSQRVKMIEEALAKK